MRRRRNNREKGGLTLVEFAAACVFGLPLIMTIIYVCLEANFLFSIRTNLDIAVRRAAQALIDDYATNHTAQNDGGTGRLPATLAFDIKTVDNHYFVNRLANQFTWTWDFSAKPYTVTVTASYPAGGDTAHGILKFPSPDPLKLGQDFKILTQGTFPVPPN